VCANDNTIFIAQFQLVRSNFAISPLIKNFGVIVATNIGDASVGGPVISIHRGIDIDAAYSVWLVSRLAANVSSM